MDLEQRIAQLSPAKLALLEQKLKKNKPNNRTQSAAKVAEREKYSPLSFSQERLWFLEQMEPDSCLYNLPAMLPLLGAVDPRLVEDCVRQIVVRHSALRTRFVVKDNDPYQLITDDVREALDFATIDLRSHAPNAAPLSQTINDEIWVPFNLATGPLLRVRLILQRNNENVMLAVMHHIISDGWSNTIFMKEFRSLYESGYSGTPSTLPPLPQQYVDYSRAQRETLAGERLESLLSYWRAQLDGAPAVLGLPLDRPRPARQSFNGALYPFNVPRSSLQELKQICRESGVVPFMVLLSAFKVLLFRYTHQAKIVVGTPIANRGQSEHESVIGFFTNTLVLASSLTPDMTFRELLAKVRDTTLGAYQHQELPFEKLVSELQPERSLSYNPLFQVMFTFQNLPQEKAELTDAPPPERPGDALSLDFKFSKFDLTLAMTEENDGYSAVFEYATDLFDPDTIQRMAGHFDNVLQHVLRNPDEPVAAFSLLSPSERRLIVDEWNDTGRTWPEILPLHGRFERWATETPDATAVVFRDTALTYAQLDRRANRVAALLRSKGVGRGSIVGICLRRSLDMVAGLLGILKAGAAYMPIEPDFPENRIAYMLDDAKATQVLTTADCLPVLARHEVGAIVLDQLDLGAAGDDGVPPSGFSPTDLAYVLFTSGSTGQPKGVMVSHGAIANRLQWMQAQYGLRTTDRVMQKTPYTFDVSLWEFFWTLSEGACLVVAEPERHKESLYLVELIQRHRVTCLHFVPSMLQLFLHEDLTGCASLKRIICSGEALSVEQCRRLQALPGVSAHNLYGPTEAAVDVTAWDCSEWRDQYVSVPIGRPIANTQIYILNEKLQPAPIGVPGELYISGHNLAEGYLHKPELTEKTFVKNPFGGAGARMYKTGDLARFRSDGNIEYIGRMDSQVKLRGLRIELGEIEYLLGQYPGIAEAIVVVSRFGDHDERLSAYVVLKDPGTPLDTRAVSVFLGKSLPNYMVPSTIMVIPDVPLTANGKLDRKQLPEPAIVRTSEPAEPASDFENELVAIWRKFLRTDTLETNDDFFAAGGHSILATQVINSINGHYHLNVPMRLLFENSTVKTFAKALSEFEDEVWLDESKTATTIFMRSNRRLLQTLDELGEEQLDDFLRQRLEDPLLARFDDVASLLAWAHKYETASAAKPKAAGVAAAARPAGSGSTSPVTEFWLHYLELARIKVAIDNVHVGRYDPLHVVIGGGAAGELVAKLQDEGRDVFERYAHAVAQRLGHNVSGWLLPTDLHETCLQLVSVAQLAASIEVGRAVQN